MSSESITMKLVRRPARGASFFLRTVWAVIVLAAVILLWITLFILFLPFLLLGEFLEWRMKQRGDANAVEPAMLDGAAAQRRAKPNGETQLIFDRRADVSKLYGCNTRNVEYRWDLFANKLSEIKRKNNRPKALDFGAGSLRDSFEMIRQGFEVTAMDLDPAIMQKYFASYNWSSAGARPRLFADSIERLRESLGRECFDLAISFDVIEHLERPEDYLQNLRPLLGRDAYLFVIVPNRRSIHERYFKYSLRKHREKGVAWTPGVPHLQFRSPEEWASFITASGFEILEHDMAIGPLVNDVCYGILALPIRVFVVPVLERLAFALRLRINAGKLEEFFTPAWLMAAVNVWDELLKQQFRHRFGWNLIIARRK